MKRQGVSPLNELSSIFPIGGKPNLAAAGQPLNKDRFLHRSKEIQMKAIPEGQYIKHYRYGLGVVTESDDSQTSIDFDLHGLKRFVTTLMVVELSNLTPPPRVRAKHGDKVYARLASKKGAANPLRGQK
jgi:hypothetical protein